MDKKQYDFLLNLTENEFLSIKVLSINEKFVVIEIEENTAEKIRNLATDCLDVYGFDENYELNSNGELAENIIDLFYV